MNSKIGYYIHQVAEKNSSNMFNNVLGIAIEKEFMPSVANIIGTDLSKYNVIRKGRFAFNPMHVGRDEKLPISLYLCDKPGLISPAYMMFELNNDANLLPEYLNFIFKTSLFDRICWFHTDASVRGGISWDDFTNLLIPVPPIEQQRKMVHDYKVITDRIELLKKINENLFEMAKLIMKEKYTVDGFFAENISISEFCENTVSGATPNKSKNTYWDSFDVPWLKNGEVKNNIILDTEEYISLKALNETSVKLLKKHTVNMAMYCVSDIQVSYSSIPLTTNQAVLNMTVDSFRKASFLYYYLATFGNDITSNANGSAQQNLSKEIIDAHVFKKPILDDKFFDFFEANLNERIAISKQIKVLNEANKNLMFNLREET